MSDGPFFAGGMRDERKFKGAMWIVRHRQEAGSWLFLWRDAGILVFFGRKTGW